MQRKHLLHLLLVLHLDFDCIEVLPCCSVPLLLSGPHRYTGITILIFDGATFCFDVEHDSSVFYPFDLFS
jgi:hypothetical protein